jgi:predicted N-acetyltransferase YhbS
MTPTLRRLNDRERYYGLTWPGWLALAIAGGVLYGAIRVSPFGLRPTVTVVVLVLAFFASVGLALQGQTIGPGRYLLVLDHAAADRLARALGAGLSP